MMSHQAAYPTSSVGANPSLYGPSSMSSGPSYQSTQHPVPPVSANQGSFGSNSMLSSPYASLQAATAPPPSFGPYGLSRQVTTSSPPPTGMTSLDTLSAVMARPNPGKPFNPAANYRHHQTNQFTTVSRSSTPPPTVMAGPDSVSADMERPNPRNRFNTTGNTEPPRYNRGRQTTPATASTPSPPPYDGTHFPTLSGSTPATVPRSSTPYVDVVVVDPEEKYNKDYPVLPTVTGARSSTPSPPPSDRPIPVARSLAEVRQEERNGLLLYLKHKGLKIDTRPAGGRFPPLEPEELDVDASEQEIVTNLITFASSICDIIEDRSYDSIFIWDMANIFFEERQSTPLSAAAAVGTEDSDEESIYDTARNDYFNRCIEAILGESKLNSYHIFVRNTIRDEYPDNFYCNMLTRRSRKASSICVDTKPRHEFDDMVSISLFFLLKYGGDRPRADNIYIISNDNFSLKRSAAQLGVQANVLLFADGGQNSVMYFGNLIISLFNKIINDNNDKAFLLIKSARNNSVRMYQDYKLLHINIPICNFIISELFNPYIKTYDRSVSTDGIINKIKINDRPREAFKTNPDSIEYYGYNGFNVPVQTNPAYIDQEIKFNKYIKVGNESNKDSKYLYLKYKEKYIALKNKLLAEGKLFPQ
jgi:hypothetical protein